MVCTLILSILNPLTDLDFQSLPNSFLDDNLILAFHCLWNHETEYKFSHNLAHNHNLNLFKDET